MGIDQKELQRRRSVDKPKHSTKHPYFALEHRITDSDAYADLGFAARNLLDLIGRQLTKDNNGHLQATFAWCKRYGFGSEHTLRAAIVELIKHGFIFKTRSHGANGAWARYALTWLPIKKTEELYLDTFKPNAWREWQPEQKKSSRQKLPEQSSRKCSFTPELPAETAGKPTAETADYETCCHGSEVKSPSKRTSLTRGTAWMPAYLGRLERAGHAGRQCFEIPASRTLQ
jgi:hypothetical protein